jgi:hypothetical protein
MGGKFLKNWVKIRRMKLIGLIAGLFCAVFAAPCFAQSAGSVVFVSGAAVIEAKDGQSREAVRGGEFFVGDTIDTVGARVQLRFLDGASMSLQPGTRFRIEDFRFVVQDGKASGEDRGIFSLIKGGFRTITGLIGKQRREQYRVDTAVATIGIRGTDYSAQMGNTGLSLSTFGGLVEVCNGAGCAQVGPGETAVVADRDSRPLLKGRQGDSAGGALTGPGVPAVPSPPPPTPVITPEMAPVRTAPVTGPYNY